MPIPQAAAAEFFGPVQFDFAIERPRTLAEAIALSQDADVHVIGFGNTWQKWLRRRMVTPQRVVVLDRVQELQGIEVGPDAVEIGAMTTLDRLIGDEAIGALFPILSAVSRTIAGPAIRGWASIGGNVALRYDLGAPLIALRAELEVWDADGPSVTPAGAAMADAAFPAPGQIIRAVRIPRREITGWGYQRFMPRKGHAFSLLAVAVTARVAADGTVVNADVAVGAPESVVPMALDDVGEGLVSTRPTADDLVAASGRAAAAIDPDDDGKASPWYRKELARVGTRRALAQSISATGR